jgi:hypothetical protein
LKGIAVPSVTFIPDSLSAAQHDMFRRMPSYESDASNWAEFHRYNAEMFRLSQERFPSGPGVEDWAGQNIEIQLGAVQRYERQLEGGK